MLLPVPQGSLEFPEGRVWISAEVLEQHLAKGTHTKQSCTKVIFQIRLLEIACLTSMSEEEDMWPKTKKKHTYYCWKDTPNKPSSESVADGPYCVCGQFQAKKILGRRSEEKRRCVRACLELWMSQVSTKFQPRILPCIPLKITISHRANKPWAARWTPWHVAHMQLCCRERNP